MGRFTCNNCDLLYCVRNQDGCPYADSRNNPPTIQPIIYTSSNTYHSDPYAPRCSYCGSNLSREYLDSKGNCGSCGAPDDQFRFINRIGMDDSVVRSRQLLELAWRI